MKIKDGKYLNQNSYTSVSIKKDFIVFKNDNKKMNTFDSGRLETNALRNLDDKEKVSIVLNHYLENTRLSYIGLNRKYRKEPCMLISGSRLLRIFNKISPDDARAIMNKYRSDRLKTLFEERYDYIFITSSINTTGCFIAVDFDGKIFLNVILGMNNGDLTPGELDFFNKVVEFAMNGEKGRFHSYIPYSKLPSSGVYDIKHKIICQVDMERKLFKIWNKLYNEIESIKSNQISIDEYIKTKK